MKWQQNRLFLIIVLVVVFSLTYKTNLTNKQQSFILGNFTVSIQNTDIVKSNNDIYGNVEVTKILPKNGDTTDCIHVTGLNTLNLEKTNPIPQSNYHNLTISFEEWNLKDLKFESKEYQEKASIKTKQLTTLENFPDHDNPDLAPWREFYSCAGIYSIPFLIKKVTAKEFDNVFFAEVSEGNGDTYSYPARTLIINKNDDWLIIKDQQKLSEMKSDGTFDGWPGCPVGNLTQEELNCAMEVWAKKFRNSAQDEIWIKKMLNSVSYTKIF